MAGWGFNSENEFNNVDPVSQQRIINAVPLGESHWQVFKGEKEDFNIADLQAVIDWNVMWNNSGKFLNVIYSAAVNPDYAVADDQLDNIDTVIDGGVNVAAVRMGNEEFRNEATNQDFALYRTWFEPLAALIWAKYPDMPIILPLAPEPVEIFGVSGDSGHTTFNNALIAYIAANRPQNYQIAIHIYYDNKECPILATRPSERIYKVNDDYPDLVDFYSTLWAQTKASTLWERTLSYTSLIDADLYITEWGYQDYGNIKNTLGLGMMSWMTWCKYGFHPKIKVMCQHNGNSDTTAGHTSPTTNKDLNPEMLVKLPRVDFHTYKMWREFALFQTFTELPTSLTLSYPTASGRYAYWYCNEDEDYAQTLRNVAGRFGQSIAGRTMHESSGFVQWMADTSDQSYYIVGDDPNGGYAERMSYGWTVFDINRCCRS